MTSTINGLAVLKATVREPRSGNWQALLEIDADETTTVLKGAVVVNLEGVSYVGVVRRGDLDSGRMKIEVVGGRGGLNKTIDALDYFYAGRTIILADLLRDAGEALDPTSSTADLNTLEPKWVRAQGEAQLALTALSEHAGLTWRVTRAGLVWLGTESWLPTTVQQIQGDYDPETGVMVIAPDYDDTAQLVSPGTTLDGKRVSHVETTIDGTELRQSLTFEGDDGRERGGPWTEIREFVRRLVEPGLAYARSYVGNFHFQRGDGSIDVRPDSEVMRAGFNGVTSAKMRHGLPGLTARGIAGGRPTILFDEGSPAKPYAALWEDGTGKAEAITLSVGTLTVDGNETVRGALHTTGESRLGAENANQKMVLGTAHAAALNTVMTAIGTYVAALGAGTPADPLTKGAAAAAAAPLATALTTFMTHLSSTALSSKHRLDS